MLLYLVPAFSASGCRTVGHGPAARWSPQWPVRTRSDKSDWSNVERNEESEWVSDEWVSDEWVSERDKIDKIRREIDDNLITKDEKIAKWWICEINWGTKQNRNRKATTTTTTMTTTTTTTSTTRSRVKRPSEWVRTWSVWQRGWGRTRSSSGRWS